MRAQNGGTEALGLIGRSAVFRTFLAAFRNATGMSLTLVDGDRDEPPERVRAGSEPKFCRLLQAHVAGCRACAEFEQGLCARALTEKRTVSEHCFAGLVEAAVPVFTGRQWAGTLVAGKVFRQRPGAAAWNRVAATLGDHALSHKSAIRKAYRTTPVLGPRRADAALRLLEVFAAELEQHLPGWLLSRETNLPPAVAKARQYLLEHGAEPMRLPIVARHAGMSAQHFSKLFHQSTGLTFTEFTAQFRIENAKSLLHDGSRRVADIAFECGFGSLPTFNRVFKGLLGLPPTVYRRSLEAAGGSGRVAEEIPKW